MTTKTIKGIEFIDGYGRCPKCHNIFHESIFPEHIDYCELREEKNE